MLFCANVQAQESLTVIYPEVPSPYNQIFAEILGGIESQYTGNLVIKSLQKSDAPNNTVAWIDDSETDMLIALGSRGYKVAKQIYKKKPVVIGALPIRPNGMSGISLLADPKILFETLRDLAPQINKVHVVYSPPSRWLIDLANEQAKHLGLELNQLEVKSLKTAAQTYESLLDSVDSANEAVWLPLDSISANEQVILPNLLEKSWEQNIVLFSSKPAHAKRGALFSLFPDHNALGQQLVNMVVQMHQEQSNAGVKPLQDMKLAVNLRTAAHLGLDYKNRQKDAFHLTFPQ